ncbi:uncharacterized protein LOC122962681 [Acropora millepora]|uniref:uncharacterized protein LOC122962681 n=1 Tax=Acropora millepora TaxID=45264 RepID=UPI001CF53B69|nr:uncharacterized protein LOC122962681 [Acropora millepora]
METYSKRNVMGLSIAQIVLSAAFFLLGMVDGFHIQFVHVSPMFLPCWIAALVLPVGIMGLALSSHQTLRLLQLLKHAIWSFCVVCIICSALIVYIYTAWGLSYILWIAHFRNIAGYNSTDAENFVAKEDKMVYTEKEKAALVVFAFVIICSVIEIVLSAAMIKICKAIAKTSQESSNCGAYYQMGECHQPRLVYPVMQEQDVQNNQSSQ